jgi:hypothetical protein
MLRSVVASTVMLSVLGGCVSQVQLANNKGQTAQCNAAGLGIVGAAVAASGQKECIERYQSQGYHQVALPASANAATTPAADTAATTAATKPKAQADQCNTYGIGIISSLIAASMQQTCQAGSATSAAAAPAATSDSKKDQ